MTLIATVKSRKGQRKGRGFSEEELKKAGLTTTMAKKLKIIIDTRRKSAYDANVAELKKVGPLEKKPKVKKAVKVKRPEKKVTKKPAKKQVKKEAPKSKPKSKPRATKSKKK